MFSKVSLRNLNCNLAQLAGPCRRIEQIRLPLLSRKEFQVFKNVSFDSRAIAASLFLWAQNTRLFL